MNILVIGYGHFAGVVASCLHQKGFQVWQADEEPYILRAGHRLASDEPGYVGGYDIDWPTVMAQPDLVWVAYDCPLDANGLPVVDDILARIKSLHRRMPIDTPFLVSCQWPVGTFAKMRATCTFGRSVAYVMENVRVGKAIGDFLKPSAWILGHTGYGPRTAVLHALEAFTLNMIWILPESAEMAKHTTNAFMALQIAFINEIAAVCRSVKADPDQVSNALKADWRVSPNAPLAPGGPFGGGSLSRDVRILENLTIGSSLKTPLLWAIHPSNDARK